MDPQLKAFEDLRLVERADAKAKLVDAKLRGSGVEKAEAALVAIDRKIREAADAYVQANRDKFAEFEGKSLEECINLLERARRAYEVSEGSMGAEACVLAEMWIEAKFEKQNIGGTATVKVRF